MDKNMGVFVLKFEHVFEKKAYVIAVFPWSILFAKAHETWNSRLCFHWINLQKKIWMKKIMFKNDMGLKRSKI